MLVRDAVAMLAGSGLEALGPMTWADLGCGDGIFTVALADLLAPCSVIHAIDRNRAALKRIPSHRHDVRIHTHLGDFIEPWPFGAVDGILMANSLHYVSYQEAFVRSCESQMTSPRRVLIVEYDTNKPNAWVPYPVSRSRLEELFSGYSFRSLESRQSRYHRVRLYAELMEGASASQILADRSARPKAGNTGSVTPHTGAEAHRQHGRDCRRAGSYVRAGDRGRGRLRARVVHARSVNCAPGPT